MSTRVLAVGSAATMERLGKWLGERLQPGDFIGLVGDLGAGKTVLARGIAEGAGVPPEQVASPSFAIVYPYRGRITVHHADLYRLADEEELYATGFFDLLKEPAATVVEWIDRIPEAAPPEHLLIHITRTGEGTRALELEPQGSRHEALAGMLEAAAGEMGRG